MVRGSFINGLLDGLLKLAAETHRMVQAGGRPVWLDKRVPVLSGAPVDSHLNEIERLLGQMKKQAPSSAGKILRTDHVAIPAEEFGDPEQRGFKRSRLHVPLPEERFLTKSWRKGQLHVHRSGPMYLVHKDDISPRGLRAPVHFMKEGLPAIVNRWKKRGSPPVVSATNPNVEAK